MSDLYSPNVFKIFKEFIIHEDVFVQIMLFIPAYPYYFSYRCISKQWFYCLENKVYKLVQKLSLLNQHVNEVEEEKEKLKSLNRQDLLLSFPKWKLIQQTTKQPNQESVMQFLTETFPNVRKLRFLIWNRTSELLLQHCILNFAHLQSVHIYYLRYFVDHSFTPAATGYDFIQSLSSQYPIEKLKLILFPIANTLPPNFLTITNYYKHTTLLFRLAYVLDNNALDNLPSSQIVSKYLVETSKFELVNYLFDTKKIPVINFFLQTKTPLFSNFVNLFLFPKNNIVFEKLVQLANLAPLISASLFHQLIEYDIDASKILLHNFVERKNNHGTVPTICKTYITLCDKCKKSTCNIFHPSILNSLKQLGWKPRFFNKMNGEFVNPLKFILSSLSSNACFVLEALLKYFPEVICQGDSDGIITIDSENHFDPVQVLYQNSSSFFEEKIKILNQYDYKNQLTATIFFWRLYYSKDIEKFIDFYRENEIIYQVDGSTLSHTPLLGCLLQKPYNDHIITIFSTLTEGKNCNTFVSKDEYGDSLFHVYVKYTTECREPILKLLFEQFGVNVKNALHQTPLFSATHFDVVSYLINSGADTTLKDSFDRSVFEFHLEKQQFDTAKLFAPQLDDLNLDCYWQVSPTTGRVLLHYLSKAICDYCKVHKHSVQEEPLQTMVALFTKSLSLSSKHDYFFSIDKLTGKSPIAYILDSNSIYSVDLVRQLKNLETIPIAANNMLYIFYVLHQRHANQEYIKAYLVNCINWNVRDETKPHQPTPLHTIIELKLTAVLEFVVKNYKDQIDWNSITKDGKNALDIALEHNSAAMIEILLKVKTIHFEKEAVFSHLWKYQHYSLCAYFVEEDLFVPKEKAMLMSMINHLLDLSHYNFSATLIHQLFSNLKLETEQVYTFFMKALKANHFSFCKHVAEWLHNNATPQFLFELFHKTNLLACICCWKRERNTLPILQQLLPLVIAVDKEVLNQQNETGKTALHFACQNMNLSVANYLYSLGADDTITENGSAKTCYELMKYKNEKEFKMYKATVCMGKREEDPSAIVEQDAKRRKK